MMLVLWTDVFHPQVHNMLWYSIFTVHCSIMRYHYEVRVCIYNINTIMSHYVLLLLQLCHIMYINTIMSCTCVTKQPLFTRKKWYIQ